MLYVSEKNSVTKCIDSIWKSRITHVFCNKLVHENTMSIKVLKKSLFSQIWGHFSVHKSEKSKFLARIHMKYFHMAISVILRVYLIRKYGCAKPRHFYSYFIDFSTLHVPLARFFCLAQFLLPVNWIDYLHSKGACWAALEHLFWFRFSIYMEVPIKKLHKIT